MLDNWIAGRLMITSPVTRDKIDSAKFCLLKNTFEYAKTNSKYYAKKFKGVTVNNPEDIINIPFTYPKDILENGKNFICTSYDDIDRIFTMLPTTGSTGLPKKIYFAQKEINDTIEYFQHGLSEFAVAGDTAAILFPGSGENSMNAFISEALIRNSIKPVILGFPHENEYEAALKSIIDCGATYLIGPSFLIAKLADLSTSVNLANLIASKVNSVLLAGSFVSEKDKSRIVSAWKCRIDEEYGMTETGLGGAVGCSAGGYHAWESDLLYEIVNPVSGENVPVGTYGEIVVTTLRRKVMPIIRYRTGDISRFLPSPCECGSILQHLDTVGDRHCEKKYNRSRIKNDENTVIDF